MEWLHNYLNLYSTYIKLEVELDNLENVEVILLNLFKSRKDKIVDTFPLGYQVLDIKEASEIIMKCVKDKV